MTHAEARVEGKSGMHAGDDAQFRDRMRRLPFRMLFFITMLFCGCSFEWQWGEGSSFEDNGASGGGQVSPLPDPQQPNGEQPVLDEAQQKRKEEADTYIAEVIYQGATIIEAIQLPSGDIIDGLDRNTLPALPYALPPLPFTPEDLQLPPGVELGLPDFEQYPELLDLVTTATPFQRPDFSAYIMGETDATSIEDYLDRYQIGGQPSDNKRLYAGLISTEPNLGVSGHMNQFHPAVEPGTFSLIEFSVFCPAPPAAVQEQIGVVIIADKITTDGRPRLRVEYARPRDGKIKYVWDGVDGQFRANPFRRHRPSEVVPISVVAGQQVEHRLGIYQIPGFSDWWIVYNDDVLGYYPGHLFTMLNTGACASAWYGEVYNPDPATRGAITTEMGSGQHGSAGPLLAAYVRNPQYYEPVYWFGLKPSDNEAMWMGPYQQDCYSRTKLVDGLFYLGGDGGKNPYCIWPSP